MKVSIEKGTFNDLIRALYSARVSREIGVGRLWMAVHEVRRQYKKQFPLEVDELDQEIGEMGKMPEMTEIGPFKIEEEEEGSVIVKVGFGVEMLIKPIHSGAVELIARDVRGGGEARMAIAMEENVGGVEAVGGSVNRERNRED